MTETTVLDFDLILMYLFNCLLRFNSISADVMMDDEAFFLNVIGRNERRSQMVYYTV